MFTFSYGAGFGGARLTIMSFAEGAENTLDEKAPNVINSAKKPSKKSLNFII